MNKDTHPEQDPAEGSRKTIEKELRRQELSEKKKQSGQQAETVRREDEVPQEAG